MNQNEDKKVTKITDDIIQNRIESKSVSLEQLQREFDYIQAEKLLNKMLEKGLISEAEFNKITALNRQTFSPLLAELMT
ncbi:MAG: SHOCT domain-containing protein [Bacillota bacterium]